MMQPMFYVVLSCEWHTSIFYSKSHSYSGSIIGQQNLAQVIWSSSQIFHKGGKVGNRLANKEILK